PLLHAIEQRIERRDLELDDAARAGLDELAQLVAVPRLLAQQRQDEEVGASLLEVEGDHGDNIYESNIYRASPSARAPAYTSSAITTTSSADRCVRRLSWPNREMSGRSTIELATDAITALVPATNGVSEP